MFSPSILEGNDAQRLTLDCHRMTAEFWEGCLHQVPSASGRYILSHSHTLSSKFVCDVLSERFPQYKFPTGEDAPSKQILDNSKARHSAPRRQACSCWRLCWSTTC